MTLIDTSYEYEDVLQALLADHPDILAGDQMNAQDPRRWLLVTREAPVADSLGGPGRWSLDHMFLDQDAVPTLVEVKRSSDTRLRREVVGQMLDYAANIASHWLPGEIRRLFEEHCSRSQPPVDPEEALATFLVSPDATPEDLPLVIERFWQQASDNLAARRLRLVFVADAIPQELLRIIEFLNESMPKTDVLGVEVRQFVGSSARTYVPRVLGVTAAAMDLKRHGSPSPTLDESSFFAAIEQRGAEERDVARRLYDWALSRGLRIWWGKTVLGPMWDHPSGGGYEFTFDVRPNGTVGVPIGYMARRATFAPAGRRGELVQRLTAIPGVVAGPDAIDKGFRIKLSDLARGDAVNTFLSTYDWVLAQFRDTWTSEGKSAQS